MVAQLPDNLPAKVSLLERAEHYIELILEPEGGETEKDDFAGYSYRVSAWFSRVLTYSLFVSSLLLLPTDFWIYSEQPLHLKAAVIFHGSVAVVSFLALVGFQIYGEKHYIIPRLFGVVAIVTSAVIGHATSIVGGFQSQFAYGVFALPFVTVLLIYTLRARILLTLSVVGAWYLGLYLSRPELWAFESSITPIAFTLICSLSSITVGHAMTIVLRANYKKRFLLSIKTAELSESGDAKNSFISDAGAEIRTPLIQLVKELNDVSRKQDSDVAIDKVQSAASLAGVLEQIVGDVFDVADIDSGCFESEHDEIEIRLWFSNIVSMLEPYLRQGGVFLRVSVSEDVPEVVLTDADRLKHMLINMLRNSTQLVNEGEIRIRLSAGKISNGRCNCVFSVSVPNKGISGIELSKAQDNFFIQTRGKGKQTRMDIRLGLGLTSSIIQQLGGRLSIDSGTGKGTTFRIDLGVGAQENVTNGQHLRTNLPANFLIVTPNNKLANDLTRAVSVLGQSVKIVVTPTLDRPGNLVFVDLDELQRWRTSPPSRLTDLLRGKARVVTCSTRSDLPEWHAGGLQMALPLATSALADVLNESTTERNLT